MLAIAETEDWSRISHLEEEQYRLLDAFFKKPVSEQEASEVAEGIRFILDCNCTLMAKGKQQYEAIGQSLQKITTGRKAMDAYHAVQK